MKKLPAYKPAERAIVSGRMEIANVRLLGAGDVSASAEASPFATCGYVPDQWKAYVEFEICHSLPHFCGPVQAGNFIAYSAATLAASHATLRHQQLNLRHLLKAYSGAIDDEAVSRDRIIGCVVNTSFPKTPMSGWKDEQAHIQACAVVFKLAEGVNRLLGDHLASRQKQSVSIEVITTMDNIGVLRPSTGELHPFLSLPEHFVAALEDVDGGFPHVGKIDGEQLLVIYGLNGRPVSFRGVGVTPNPAERTAKIVGVAAELAPGDELLAIAAERVDTLMVGETVRFGTGATGTIREVFTSGEARLAGQSWRIAATPDAPVARVVFPGGRTVLKRVSELTATRK